jgi:hypothetical protein
MIREILGTSRFLIILAVLGSFIASATLQVFGLLRVIAVIVIVALLVAFLGQAVEWTGDFAILGLGLAVASVIVAVGVLTWSGRARE